MATRHVRDCHTFTATTATCTDPTGPDRPRERRSGRTPPNEWHENPKGIKTGNSHCEKSGQQATQAFGHLATPAPWHGHWAWPSMFADWPRVHAPTAGQHTAHMQPQQLLNHCRCRPALHCHALSSAVITHTASRRPHATTGTWVELLSRGLSFNLVISRTLPKSHDTSKQRQAEERDKESHATASSIT